MYRRISRIEDEESLLEEMLALQSQIREQRERKRITGTNRAEKYSKIFEPVTKSIEKLTPKPSIPPVEDLINLEDEGLQPPKEEPKDEFLPEIDEPGILYRQALHDVPSRLQDDGLLGLNPDNHRIGHYEYSVDGNILKVNAYDGEDHEYKIDDIDLWKLLLVKTPAKINLNLYDEHKQLLPFVEKYQQIVEDLNLIGDFGAVPGFRLRTKYKIVKKVGSGFLFTTHAPPILIPSDDQGLLRSLYVALAELRAGNNSMRNIVVPLAQEAKRKGILPESLLSSDEETWVFA